MSEYKRLIHAFERSIVDKVQALSGQTSISLNKALKELGVPKKTFFRYKMRSKI